MLGLVQLVSFKVTTCSQNFCGGLVGNRDDHKEVLYVW